MLEDLTFREREIFDLLLQRVPPKEIAHRFSISKSTLDFHRTNLYKKLGVRNIKELLAKYSTNGKAPPSESLKSLEPDTIISPSEPKKNKRFKLLMSVGIAFGIIMLALSVLLILLVTTRKKTSAVPAVVLTEK